MWVCVCASVLVCVCVCVWVGGWVWVWVSVSVSVFCVFCPCLCLCVESQDSQSGQEVVLAEEGDETALAVRDGILAGNVRERCSRLSVGVLWVFMVKSLSSPHHEEML